MLPIEIHARNQQKKEIWADLERYYKQIQQAQLKVNRTNPRYIEYYINNYHLSENEIQQFINKMNYSLIMFHPGWDRQLQEELFEDEAFLLAEQQDRELHFGEAAEINVAANQPSSGGPAGKFGWGSWACLLLVILLSILKYLFNGSDPSNILTTIQKEGDK